MGQQTALLKVFFPMDLHVAQKSSGKGWQIAKLAALFLFALAGVLLVTCLATSPIDSATGHSTLFSTER
jgi:hypothetical protein